MKDVVIDSNKANEYRELKGGTNELLIRLLEKYISTAEDYISKAKISFSEKDHKTLYHIIHNLKGSSLTMGLLQMSEILVELETQIKQNNFENFESMLQELQEKLIFVREYFATLS
ncbi:MAG: Hpt domain-containing protein [Leptospiraceae bacterium]|nr:Hpt domain-containing protein [Leptospiraceae bacterium]MCK6379747.1 Hpt domain-containing protein [Leptospiraceae bacterium]NUM40421.1 Hpt domain-containing protein [Leptospiraceae bacterium]